MKKFKFLYWLRFIGVVMILYDHLCGLRNSDYIIVRIIEKFINQPLQLIQFFGAVGVSLFFLISGFLITTQNHKSFCLIYNKTIRILIPLIMSIAFFYFFNKIIEIILGSTYWTQFNAHDWIDSAFLICYIKGQDSVINGSIWYLFPLIMFCLLYGISIKILKKDLNFIFFVDVLYIIAIFICKQINYQIVQMQWLVFLVVPLIGLVFRLAYDHVVSIKTTVALTFFQYLLFVKGIECFRPEYYTDQPYINSCVYAILIFLVAMLLESRIVLCIPVLFISNISYSLYLLHMTFGSLIITVLENKYGFTIALLCAIIFVLVLGALFYKIVEKNIEKIKMR